jgi:hypothetical protein
VTLVNAGNFPHTLTIAAAGREETLTEPLEGGQSETATVSLPPGTYEAWCPVDGHRERGMVATVIITGGAAGGIAQVPAQLPRTGDATLDSLLGGGAAGLAGAVQVTGAAQFLSNQLSNNFGFTAIVVALLGGLQPAGVVGAGLFISALTVGGEALQRSQNVPQPIVTVISAVFVLLVLLARKLSARQA